MSKWCQYSLKNPFESTVWNNFDLSLFDDTFTDILIGGFEIFIFGGVKKVIKPVSGAQNYMKEKILCCALRKVTSQFSSGLCYFM
jgi:hypothetical protein